MLHAINPRVSHEYPVQDLEIYNEDEGGGDAISRSCRPRLPSTMIGAASGFIHLSPTLAQKSKHSKSTVRHYTLTIPSDRIRLLTSRRAGQYHDGSFNEADSGS